MKINEVTSQDFADILKDPFKHRVNKMLAGNSNEIKKMGWIIDGTPEFGTEEKFNVAHITFITWSLQRLTPTPGELLGYLKDKFKKFGYVVNCIDYTNNLYVGGKMQIIIME